MARSKSDAKRKDDAMMSMTPSGKKMTNEQVDKAADLFRVAVRKHRTEFSSEATQMALGNPELGSELLAVFRKYVEANSNTITRRIRVNRTRTPQEALDATGHVQYTDKNVVSTMPRGDGDEVEMVFFKLDRNVSDDQLEKELELRGLVSDSYAQTAVNEADPAFADTHPNGTHWKDANGKWCFATFNRWIDGTRVVDVRRSSRVWDGRWWFGGRRK